MRSLNNKTRHILLGIATIALGTVCVCTFVVCCQHQQTPQKKSRAPICNVQSIKPEGVRLDVPLFVQRCGWCWATDVAMIGTYYRKDPVRPCDLVTQTTTVAIVSTASMATTAVYADCCIPEACATTCNHGGSDKKIAKVFDLTGYPHAVIYNDSEYSFSETELQLELSNDRPVMLVVENTAKNASHVRVVSGFTPPKDPAGKTRYRVLDSNYREPFECTYDVLMLENDYRWVATWTLTATAAQECKNLHEEY